MSEVGLDYYHPKVFSERHKIIVALSALGWKGPAIAAEVGMEPTTVSKILGDPRAKVLKKKINEQYIEETLISTQERIQSNTLAAADKVIELMNGADSERVQQTSAFDILDRGGFKPREQSVSTQIKIGAKDISRLVNALEESKQEPEELEMVQDSSGVFKEVDDVASARK